ncbi:MAG: MFS transporter [Nitrospirae bacterium GWC2_56_14]|nr:MAG: MFS transporter [Nitrospirae bacterium GWC2_56_14]
MAHSLSNVVLLFAARSIRLFAYGALSVVLALYLHEIGLSSADIGLLFTLTLAGDAGITLWITTTADRFGRKKMLLLGAGLMVMAGVVFSLTGNIFLLMVAAVIGVISPSGNEIGPFLSLEQAALSQLLSAEQRTRAFGWYNLAGSLAAAAGALAGGFLSQTFLNTGMSELGSYRAVILGYAACGIVLLVVFLFLSPDVEATTAPAKERVLGLHKSKGVVLKLSALFALDAFAGGFVIQSMVAYWFHIKFGLDAAVLGSIFFGANILAGVSALLAVRIANRIGLIRTMVYTHIPSNVLLCLVPLMPNLGLAITVLLLRFSISQMDVPTRQSYTMAVVDPDERAAASGVTTIARSVGAAASPFFTGIFLASPALLAAPFLVAGGLKIVYDLLLYRNFKKADVR